MALRGVNKVILVGNLGRAPEIRYLPNGDAVANLTIATSETWKDKATGQQREKTEWHKVVLFGKIAEVAGEYFRKGSQIYVEGRLQTRKWQDQNGQDRYTTEVVVKWPTGSMQMLDKKREQGWGQPQQPNPNQQANPQYNEPPEGFDDDIPFMLDIRANRYLAYCC